jgi:hypothetical protein
MSKMLGSLANHPEFVLVGRLDRILEIELLSLSDIHKIVRRKSADTLGVIRPAQVAEEQEKHCKETKYCSMSFGNSTRVSKQIAASFPNRIHG